MRKEYIFALGCELHGSKILCALEFQSLCLKSSHRGGDDQWTSFGKTEKQFCCVAFYPWKVPKVGRIMSPWNTATDSSLQLVNSFLFVAKGILHVWLRSSTRDWTVILDSPRWPNGKTWLFIIREPFTAVTNQREMWLWKNDQRDVALLIWSLEEGSCDWRKAGTI